MRERARRLREARKLSAQCVDCGAPAKERFTCDECTWKANGRKRERYAIMKCTAKGNDVNKPEDNFVARDAREMAAGRTLDVSVERFLTCSRMRIKTAFTETWPDESEILSQIDIGFDMRRLKSRRARYLDVYVSFKFVKSGISSGIRFCSIDKQTGDVLGGCEEPPAVSPTHVRQKGRQERIGNVFDENLQTMGKFRWWLLKQGRRAPHLAIPECENCGMTSEPLTRGYCKGCTCLRCAVGGTMSAAGWCEDCEDVLKLGENL